MNRAQKATKAGVLLLLCGAALSAAGCLGPQAVYRDVMESRAEAYEQWLDRREAEAAEEVRIKGKLALEDALKLSLLHNKTLLAALEDKGVARGRVVEALGEALPSAELRTSYTRLDMVSSFDVGGRGVSMGSPNNYSADLTVTQPVYRGGAIGAAIRAAQVYAALTDEQVRGVTQGVLYDTAAAYFDVLLSQQLVKVQQDAVAASKRSLEVVKNKKDNGLATEFDVLRAKVDLSNFQAEEIKQRNLVNRGKTTLLKLMGVSQDSTIELADVLTHSPMEPLYEEAVRAAYENRPDIFQAELQARLQKEALRVAYSRYFPYVDVFFTQTWARPDPHSSTVIEWGDAWKAGATMNWTLFDGLRREGRVMQDAALLRKNMIEIIDAEERALQEVQAAILSIRDAEEFVQSQEINLKSALEAERLAEVGLKAGVNTEVEMYDARAATTQAQANYYQAIHDHTLARLVLQKAMGVLGPRAGAKDVRGEAPRPAYIEPFMKEKKDAPERNEAEPKPSED